MNTNEINDILAEDRRRRLARAVNYDPLRGNSADTDRVEVATPFADMPTAWIPKSMLDDPKYPAVQVNFDAWRKLRCCHDFEYWCATCAIVKNKVDGTYVPLVLNAPQRRVAAILEADRRAGRPIRIIMLKARQWGGSTLVQTYMAWIQSCICQNWHSIICSQVKDTSSGIRGMYSKILDNYPADLWMGDEPPRFRPFERSANVREIAGRGCRVTVSSIENQDAVRGADFAMAHLSETAFWRSTPTHNPDDVIRAICGSIALLPNTFIAIESTANGVGNYFHSEWLRCSAGNGDKHAVFVPWYEIEIYRVEPADPVQLVDSFSDYERGLWDAGCALDQIYWYRLKLREYASHLKMMAEFPTTPDEAFAATSSPVFGRRAVEALRADCLQPRIGEFGLTTWYDEPAGRAKLWQLPVPGASYVASVDIGGRTERADYSVIAVLRCDGDRPEVVAQWRGHVDHDCLAFHARDIARLYNEALLVFESNSLEIGAGRYILECIADQYDNIYRRRSFDRETNLDVDRVGFRTSHETKGIIIDNLIAMVRDHAYIERDEDAINELLTYELSPEGRYEAKDGCHDDILMTRAIALHVAPKALPQLPKIDYAAFFRRQ